MTPNASIGGLSIDLLIGNGTRSQSCVAIGGRIVVFVEDDRVRVQQFKGLLIRCHPIEEGEWS